jgi:hypothetical protein
LKLQEELMASIYKRANSPFYYCRIHVCGKYVRRSTKEQNPRTAMKVANRLEAEACFKDTVEGPQLIRSKFLQWALEQGISEMSVLAWLEQRGYSEIQSRPSHHGIEIQLADLSQYLKRLEADLTQIKALLRTTFDPVLNLRGQIPSRSNK